MYHPFVDDQVYRIERQFRERRAATERMVQQLDTGRPSIWARLRKHFQMPARAAALPNVSSDAAK
jgi:hypothetical protein